MVEIVKMRMNVQTANIHVTLMRCVPMTRAHSAVPAGEPLFRNNMLKVL